jgi:hypothetical protein
MKPVSLCVIGNSHIAALKLGWEVIRKRVKGVEITFFGSAGRGIADLVLSEGRLVPSTEKLRQSLAYTSEGRETIDCSAYDLFCLAGMVSCRWVGFSLKSHCPMGEGRENDARDLVSAPFVRQVARSLIDQSVALQTARKIRAATTAPILIMPAPLPSIRILKREKTARQFVGVEYLEPIFGDEMNRAAAALDSRYLPQPPETRQGAIFTKNIFSVGSVRLTQELDRRHARCESGHMNQRFGVRVLKAVFATFPEVSLPAPTGRVRWWSLAAGKFANPKQPLSGSSQALGHEDGGALKSALA